MSGERQGIMLYGYGAEAVAEALRDLDPRYVLGAAVTTEAGQVPVLRHPDGAAADAACAAAPGVDWLVFELYRPGSDLQHAHGRCYALNTAKVDPETAARAIDQYDLVVWYEVIHPIQCTTVDNEPVADDYRNVRLVMPSGHRSVAHAVREETAPECLPDTAELVLRSDDLWELAKLRDLDLCPACVLRQR
ncbi:hypothetical protein [Catellatospora methionotrophica]|uniref:hypothetical protein n=1 Tax=Catellatospora methionotrophica TaxID=121620 RepID=UPI0033D6B38B